MSLSFALLSIINIVNIQSLEIECINPLDKSTCNAACNKALDSNSGFQDCRQTTLECPPDKDCNIDCFGNIDRRRLINTQFQTYHPQLLHHHRSLHSVEDCIVNSYGCCGSTITCPANKSCTIDCSRGCNGVKIDARSSSNLIIHSCVSTRGNQGSVNQCEDMTIHCPRNGQRDSNASQCAIHGYSHDSFLDNITIYTEEGFNDITIDSIFNSITNSKIYCGLSNQYSCYIDIYGAQCQSLGISTTNITCSSFILPTSQTSPQPTPNPSAAPTSSPITQWSLSPLGNEMPKSDYAMAIGQFQNRIYIIGGSWQSGSLMTYNTTSGSFSYNATAFPLGLYASSQFYAQIGSNLYIAGTSNGIDVFMMETEQFISNWTLKPQNHGLITCLAGANDRLYYIGTSLYILNIKDLLWSRGADMNVPRGEFSCVATWNNKLYSIGGAVPFSNTISNTVEYISTQNISSNLWHYTPNNLTLGLSHTRSVLHNDHIFVVGGVQSNVVSNMVHIIDIISNVISVDDAILDDEILVAAVPVIVINGTIYAFGGRDNTKSTPPTNKWQYHHIESTATPTTEASTLTQPTASPTPDPSTSPSASPSTQATAQWISPSENMLIPNLNMAIGHHQDIIYIIGGTTSSLQRGVMEFNSSDNTFLSYDGGAFQKEFYAYSQFYVQIGSILYMTGNSDNYVAWVDMDSFYLNELWILSEGDKGLEACLTGLDNSLYYIGGSQLWILSIVDQMWNVGPNMTESRASFSCIATSNDKLYSVGGYDDGPLETVEYISSFPVKFWSWNYTPNNLTLGLSHTRSVVHHNQIFVIGGNGGSGGTDLVHIIDTISNVVTVSSITLAYPIYGTSAIVINDTIYAFGGQFKNNTINQWQYYHIESPTNEPTPTPTDDYPTAAPLQRPTIAPSRSPTTAPSEIPPLIDKYVPVNISLNWTAAETRCQQDFGQHLASIHANSDFQQIQQSCDDMIKIGSAVKGCWIGLQDRENEGVYVWTDDTDFDFGMNISGGVYPWRADAPTNINDGNDCVELRVTSSSGWNDLDCSNQNYFVCNMASLLCDASEWNITGDASFNVNGIGCDVVSEYGSKSMLYKDKWEFSNDTVAYEYTFTIHNVHTTRANEGRAGIVIYPAILNDIPIHYFVGIQFIKNESFIFVDTNESKNKFNYSYPLPWNKYNLMRIELVWIGSMIGEGYFSMGIFINGKHVATFTDDPIFVVSVDSANFIAIQNILSNITAKSLFISTIYGPYTIPPSTTASPAFKPTASLSEDTLAPSISPTICVDYNDDMNSDDGLDIISKINISIPNIEEAIYRMLQVNQTIIGLDTAEECDQTTDYCHLLCTSINPCTSSSITANDINIERLFVICQNTSSCNSFGVFISNSSITRVDIRCKDTESCTNMSITINNATINSINIHCKGRRACENLKYDCINAQISKISFACLSGYSCSSSTIISVGASSTSTAEGMNLYCMETRSCKELFMNVNTKDIDNGISNPYTVHINCVQDNSCEESNIGIYGDAVLIMNMFEYSKNVEISSPNLNSLEMKCGSEEDRIFIKYDVFDIKTDDEILDIAREEYGGFRLPCEGIILYAFNY